MSWLNLVVAQYEIQGHPRRTEHWALVVLHNKHVADIYEIVGGITNYRLQPKRVTSYSRAASLRGGCHVGYIASTSLEQLLAYLQQVRVVRNSVDWDCQTWVWEALVHLRSARLPQFRINIFEDHKIRHELAQEMERWNGSEDLLEDRLFP
ncbi:hypothetical protein EXIGLDRAFT_760217 [Exidia glandulosa HHB12029]|uniref:Uncharacterized protein n=1 Tax=Exidia glandulosa HHB12029 TaxID=1314781 RepID=A0A165PCU1_EXIGL|nr:hypothetical protein EXIGLDRAFT_760217 [Exidia glandulosa HHB12029]